MKTDHERLRNYVKRHLRRTQGYPTVRQTARALRWTQAHVEEVVDGDPDGTLSMTSYHTVKPEPLGDHFVEDNL